METCSHTQEDAQNYWTVDLRTRVNVAYLMVTNRNEVPGNSQKAIFNCFHGTCNNSTITCPLGAGYMWYICILWYQLIAPGRRQAIIWINAGMLSMGNLVTNFIEILKEIHTFSFKTMHLKLSPSIRRPCCLRFNVLRCWLKWICVCRTVCFTDLNGTVI